MAKSSWNLNLSDESDEEGQQDDVNKEADNFANLFSGSPETENNNASVDLEVKDLLKDVEKSIEFGPELLPEVADGFNKTMTRPLSKETSDNLKNKFKIALNCKSLMIPKMNQEIWSHLPANARLTDLNLQQNQQSLGIGLNALSQIANEIAKSASSIPKELKTTVLKLAIDAGNILGDQVQTISKKRRYEVKKHINSEYHGICSVQISSSEFLFGNDLNETLKASKTASSVIRKSFIRGNSQGQGQRYRPYNYKSNLNYNRPRASYTPQRQQYGQYQRGQGFQQRRGYNQPQQSNQNYFNPRK